MTGCQKPGFFTQQRPLFQVNPADGTLLNTDNGSPVVSIGEDGLPASWQRRGCDSVTERPAHVRCCAAPARALRALWA